MKQEKIPTPLYRYLRDNHQCQNCGACCHCKPIAITGIDIKVMAFKLGMSPKDFKKQYTEAYPGDARMSHFKQEDPCAFLDENNRCKIYESRPAICRLYPLIGGKRIPSECQVINSLLKQLTDENGNQHPEVLIPYTANKKGF